MRTNINPIKLIKEHKVFSKIIFSLILANMLIMFNVKTLWAQEESDPNITKDRILEPFQLNVYKNESYPLDLESTLKLALENNLELSIKEQDVKINKYEVYSQISTALPDIIGTYDQSRFQGGVQIFGNATFKIYRTVVQPQAALRWTIFSGGETVYSILTAKRQLKATEYSVQESKDKLLLAAATAYYELQNAYEKLEIAKKQIDETTAVLDMNQKRLDAGLGTILEVSQSEGQLAQSKYSFIQADKNIVLASQNLNQILNLPLNINIIPTDKLINKKVLFDTQNADELLNIAIDNRPDLKYVKELKRIILAQRGIARSKFFPKISLNTYIAGAGPRFADLEQQRYIGYGVQMDFLKGLGLNYVANYKKSGPMLKQADMKIEQKLRDIETELAKSLLNAEASDKEIVVAKTGLKFAEDSYKYSTARLEAGVGTNIDVLTAQTALTTARTAVTDSIISFNKSQVQLLYSIGRINVDRILGKAPVLSSKTQDNTENKTNNINKINSSNESQTPAIKENTDPIQVKDSENAEVKEIPANAETYNTEEVKNEKENENK